jgi:antitoxin component YwqK of YwqJK toxin-antitoxin module
MKLILKLTIKIITLVCTIKESSLLGRYLMENAIIQFKNGNAHGKSVEYYDNGQLAEECYFENGLCKF